MKIIKLSKEKVTFTISTHEEHTPISSALSFKETGADHSEYINKVENDNGFNPWLWCVVCVTASIGQLKGVNYLGQYASESEADFIAGGYYEQMKDEALADLQAAFDEIIESI
jgi:hypothetical protein